MCGNPECYVIIGYAMVEIVN